MDDTKRSNQFDEAQGGVVGGAGPEEELGGNLPATDEISGGAGLDGGQSRDAPTDEDTAGSTPSGSGA